MGTFYEKENITKIGYMDRTDFEDELSANSDGTKVYPSISALKLNNPLCWKHCGIVKVQVELLEVIIEGDGED